MKKTLLFSALAMLMATPEVSAVTLPIYSDEPIDEAPAGTVVSNAIRKGFSYYYSYGDVYGGYNDSFVGEYVIGDDGNIYLKDACASTSLGTYLKLDRIDDENYVAHTAQMIYADLSGDTPYVAYATRLVFHQYSEYSYGYTLEEGEDGQAVTDVYFTLKDGVLKQVDQEIIDMNGQLLPHELIAFTNATGGWMGYGDGCIEISTIQNTPTTLPEGAEVKELSFAWNALASHGGFNTTEATLVKCAEVGDEIYVTTPDNQEAWIKGQIDRTAGTVSFQRQYIGQNQELGIHQWFMPATYYDWFDVWDEEDGDGYWMRDYEAADAYVCKYQDGALVSDPEAKQAFFLSRSETEMAKSAAYANVTINPYTEQLVTPATPIINFVEPNNGWWGEFHFALPNVDVNNTYIDQDNLYYRLYVNSEELFEFTTEDFGQLPANCYDMPATYADSWDFEHNGTFYTIYFYNDWQYVGVQAVCKIDGEERTSDIAWYNHTPSGPVTGLNMVPVGEISVDGKRMEQGRVIIRKHGADYSVMGQRVK